MLHRGSKCSPPQAMDGCIMRHGIISLCQSVATPTIVLATVFDCLGLTDLYKF